MQPWYNEVPRDRTIYFVITGDRNKRNPDITKLLKKYEKYEKRRYTGILIADKILAIKRICWTILILFITW